MNFNASKKNKSSLNETDYEYYFENFIRYRINIQAKLIEDNTLTQYTIGRLKGALDRVNNILRKLRYFEPVLQDIEDFNELYSIE